ncbi:MAG: hypothetical protein U0800_26290 [Isosphaeraceae bacterium]
MSGEAKKPIEFPRANGVAPKEDPNQAVFDTVVGPNLRLKDNQVQALAIAIGTALGAIGGFGYGWSQGYTDRSLATLAGGFAGVVLSLLLSGTILGQIRGYQAMKS